MVSQLSQVSIFRITRILVTALDRAEYHSVLPWNSFVEFHRTCSLRGDVDNTLILENGIQQD